MSEAAPSSGIESVLQEQRLFDPPEALAATARIGSLQAYRDLVARADADPDAFWGEQARSQLHWFEPFHTVLDWSNPPFARWFEGGTTNLSFNCLDRHLNGPRADKTALIWEGEPGDERRFTYRQLHAEVCKAANALKALALDPLERPRPATLIKAGLKDPDPTVRREAAEATRILQFGEAIKLLRSAARDSDWLTRSTAARLFGQRGDPSLIPDLFPMLQDADSYVRRFARRSLLELAEQAKPETYLPALKSQDRTTQIVAALALVRLNDGRGAGVLLDEIANPLGIERVECVKAVSKLVDPRVVPALRAALNDKDPEIRVVSLIALGLLKDKDSAGIFKKISTDPSSPKEVRLAAAKALDLLTKPTEQP
ncbi:hypothetical protein EBZ02_06875 [bacterium]|nr:hypothetical protein [bacterium]